MARLMLALTLLSAPSLALADPTTVAAALYVAFGSEVIAAAAFTFLYYGGAYITAFAAMYAYSGSQKRKAERAARDAMRDRTVMVRSSEAPHNVVYGETRVSGPIAYVCTSGANSEYLHLVVVLAAHELSSIESVWFNDEPVGTLDADGWVITGDYKKDTTEVSSESFTVPAGGALTLAKTPVAIQSVVSYLGDDIGSYTDVPYTQSGTTVTVTAAAGSTCVVTYTYVTGVISHARIKRFLGVAAGARDTDLETASGGAWTSAHLGKNVARLHITLKYDQDIFPSGIPNVSAVVRGKKVYDPRTGLTGWTRNAALCVRDYLTSAAGFGATASEIDETAIGVAAGICDESVNYSATQTQFRYTCDGAFTLDASRRDILQDLLGAMVGTASYSGGKWLVRAGAYVTPTLDLDDSDLSDGSIQVQARTSRRDLFNAVRGQFIDPAQKYAIVDFPPYTSSTYAAEDGGEVVYQDVALPFTSDTYRAQRIAKLILFRARQALVISATWKLPAYALQPSDTCRLTISRYGWTNKVFRVVEREYVHPHQVKLTLQEESSAVYAWNYAEASVPDTAPNTDLPDPRTVAAISGLSVSSGAATAVELRDGTAAPLARVTWNAPTDQAVVGGGQIEVRWKRAPDTVWTVETLPGAATRYDIRTAAGEIINVGVRAINGFGVRGPTSYAVHTVSANAVPNATNSVQGAGANLVRNSTMRGWSTPWGVNNTQSSGWTPSHIKPTGVSAPNPYGAFAYFGSNANTWTGWLSTQVNLTYSDRIPVIPGQRYEVQVRAKSIEGRMRLKIRCFRADNFTLLNEVPSGGVSISTDKDFFTSQDLDSYDLLWGFFTAPATAAYCRIYLETERASAALTTYYFVALPLVGQAGIAQSLPSPWADGETGGSTELLADQSATIVDQTTDNVGVTTNSTSIVTLISDSITNDDVSTRSVVVTAMISYTATRDTGGTLNLYFYLGDDFGSYLLASVSEATETVAIKGTVTITRTFSVTAGTTLNHAARVVQSGFTGSSTFDTLMLRAEVIKK